ncbi:MAG: phosphatidate cytidylyltransferase [Clostridiales bacterium]|nr:phosphatidate cytidylyltransferase [Clostridiales bacterium]
MSELGVRTIVAVFLIGLLALVVIFGGWVQACVLTLFSVLAVIEMSRMFKKKEIDICLPPLFLMAGAQYFLLFKLPAYLPILYVVCFTYILADRILNKHRKTEDAIATIFVMIYPLALLLCFGFFGFDRTDVSRVALMMVFAAPCMADNNAYLWGRKFGKHKLCPAISPKKTVEGYIAGLIGGPMGGVLVYFLQKIWGLDVHWGWLVGLGFLGGVIGQFGDLFASTFKRWAGIKDYGSIFPGHGGVMDRLDSAMVFAPVVAAFFHYVIR